MATTGTSGQEQTRNGDRQEETISDFLTGFLKSYLDPVTTCQMALFYFQYENTRECHLNYKATSECLL